MTLTVAFVTLEDCVPMVVSPLPASADSACLAVYVLTFCLSVFSHTFLFALPPSPFLPQAACRLPRVPPCWWIGWPWRTRAGSNAASCSWTAKQTTFVTAHGPSSPSQVQHCRVLKNSGAPLIAHCMHCPCLVQPQHGAWQDEFHALLQIMRYYEMALCDFLCTWWPHLVFVFT